MDILDFIIIAFALYAAYKLGEALAYVKLTQDIMTLKEHANKTIKSILTVEKINNQYYAYMNDDFVGQGSSLDEVQELVTNLVRKDPLRYSSVKVTLKD